MPYAKLVGNLGMEATHATLETSLALWSIPIRSGVRRKQAPNNLLMMLANMRITSTVASSLVRLVEYSIVYPSRLLHLILGRYSNRWSRSQQRPESVW